MKLFDAIRKFNRVIVRLRSARVLNRLRSALAVEYGSYVTKGTHEEFMELLHHMANAGVPFSVTETALEHRPFCMLTEKEALDLIARGKAALRKHQRNLVFITTSAQKSVARRDHLGLAS